MRLTDGIARRGGRSPSAARKLPQQRPRSPRGIMVYGKPLAASPWEWRYTTSPAGSSGGSAEGAEEGRQPLTGPHLPPPEAAKTKELKKFPYPKGTQTSSQRTSSALLSLEDLQRKFRLPAAQPPTAQKKLPCPKTQQPQKSTRRQTRLTIPDFFPSYPSYPSYPNSPNSPKDKYPATPPEDQSPRPGPPRQSPR